jgi:hypothetical protein
VAVETLWVWPMMVRLKIMMVPLVVGDAVGFAVAQGEGGRSTPKSAGGPEATFMRAQRVRDESGWSAWAQRSGEQATSAGAWVDRSGPRPEILRRRAPLVTTAAKLGPQARILV